MPAVRLDDATLDPRSGQRVAPAARVLSLCYEGGAMRLGRFRRVMEHGELAVGRQVEERDGLCLREDGRASRLHVVFRAEPDGVRAIDRSKNGTFVNGAKIDERRLEDGDVIRVGDSFLFFRREPETPFDAALTGLLGAAPAMRALRSSIRLMAATSHSVLLLGESGAGKEQAAKALHATSARAGPFVAVNCAAVADGLAESALFGHVAGAFTGAKSTHDGFFRAAQGGTLFLDEVGELSPLVQPKLLRALEERAVVPVGATRPVPFDARIVAATNRPLATDARSGAFRGDLFARLAEIVIQVPPLRDRREDVLPLVAAHLPPDAPPLGPELVARLLSYSWPFNVRELVKVVAELGILGRGASVLELEMVAHRLFDPPAAAPTTGLDDDDEVPAGPAAPAPTRDELLALLEQHEGKVLRIAKITGRSRRQVYRWLDEYGLDAHAWRRGS